MLWALFSDIHSNEPALDAVLEAIQAERPDRLLCLGDLVGYGARPSEVIQRIRDLGCETVVGNHDLAVVDRLDASCFNLYAREAVRWTAAQLTPEERRYLIDLPMTVDAGTINAVHGTRDEPEEFLYLQSTDHAADLMNEQPLFLGACGHTHVPMTFLESGTGDVVATFAQTVDLGKSVRALVNVGSVGQPRDEDPRASFVLFDDVKRILEIRRVEYDVESASQQIRDAGLPALLADRLWHGL